MRVIVTKGDRVRLIIEMNPMEYSMIKHGAGTIYKCSGSELGGKDPVVVFVRESFRYLSGLRDCRSA